MATRLAPLNSRLSALRRGRWIWRVMRGGMALALGLLAALAVFFLLDWLLLFGRPQRGLLLVVPGFVALWGLRRFVWPALVARETNIDLVLLVERQHGIDSDLVAALQFESPEAESWGSSRLASAVVGRVADLGGRLDVSQGLSIGRVRPLGIALGTAVGALAALALIFPVHAAVFFDRLLLGAAHYPTRTQIARIAINGRDVGLPEGAAAVPRVRFGSAVRFDVESAGIRPESGTIRLVGAGGGTTNLVLNPTSSPGRAEIEPEAEARATEQRPQVAVYGGEFPRLMESVSYQIFLGDAWTEPAPLEIIPPPVASLELEYSPPAYVARGTPQTTVTTSRQISVIEGSHVSLSVRCENKLLSGVALIVAGVRFPLQPPEGPKLAWELPATGTPLSRVTTPVPFEVEVIDADGISPESPLRGHIRVEADHAPRIAAAVVTEKVLPAARPAITWGAADDYGLARIRLHRQVIRGGGQIDQSVDDVEEMLGGSPPPKSLRGRIDLDLAQLGLAKGDQVRVTLEAIDYRGDRLGTAVLSEPVVLQVTDESGILAGLLEADEKSARQLDEIIQRQLGAGEAAR